MPETPTVLKFSGRQRVLLQQLRTVMIQIEAWEVSHDYARKLFTGDEWEGTVLSGINFVVTTKLAERVPTV